MLSQFDLPAEQITADQQAEDRAARETIMLLANSWRRILTIAIAVLVIGALFAFLLPKQYTASTSLLPPQQSSSFGSALMSQLGGLSSMASLGGLSLKNPNDLQIALMRSRTVEDAVIDRFHLMARYHARRRSDARALLESTIKTDNGVKDGLIRLQATDRDPSFAAELANGYVEEFRRATAGLAVTEASQRRLFFEQQLAAAKADLSKAEEALKSTEQKTGLLQLDGQTRAVIGSVAQLRAEIAAKEVQIRGMQLFATGENPDLQTAQEELAGLKQQLERTGASSDALLIQRSPLQESSIEYVRRLRDVKYYETIFDLLARQYEIAKVDEARQGSVVQIVDRAVTPDRKSFPKPSIMLPASLFLGLIGGAAWVLGSAALAKSRLDRSGTAAR